MFWEGAPPEQIETWAKAHVPAEMSDSVARGMESARFNLAEKNSIALAAEQFLNAAAPLQN
jgi:hypothetical protein